MNEGWDSSSHFIVFDATEVDQMTEAYGLPVYIPGYRLVAIRGWDDFVVEDIKGARFTIPTVPLREKDMLPFHDSAGWTSLRRDDRYVGRIKWYIKPIVFGGDPNLGPNQTWIDLPTHQKAVRYWNDLYRNVSRSQ